MEGVRSSPVWGTEPNLLLSNIPVYAIPVPVYAIPVPVCTIQYSYSRGAHGNIKVIPVYGIYFPVYMPYSRVQHGKKLDSRGRN